MSKLQIQYRAIMTGGLALACLLLALWRPEWRSELRAQGYYPTAVVLNGVLSLEDTPQLELQLQASARSSERRNDPLAGDGSIRPAGKGAKDAEVSLSRFPLTGWVSEGMVTLGGAVDFSTDPALTGTPVLIIANEQTGEITLYFGLIVLTGSGTVLVR